jgi:thymidylate kinase
MSHPSGSVPKLIYITGIDGSGKSTVSEHLATVLRDEGYTVDILWLRFNHVISKPLLGLCRLLGYTKYETTDGIRVGYHDFYRSFIISFLFIAFQYLDAVRVKYTKILPLLRKENHVLILDRYVYDILIDIAVDTRIEHLLSSRIGRRFKQLLPDESKTILVLRSLSDVLEARPEGKVDRNFESRFNFYEKLGNEDNINVIENTSSLIELLSSAKQIVGIDS